jgi:soluble lytic murein transglycosylase-like protein
MSWISILIAAISAAGGGSTRPTTPPQFSAAVAQQQAAIARQRAAIRQQTANLSLWIPPGSDSPVVAAAPPPACEPLPEEIISPLIESAAKTNSIEPKLIHAVMEQESGLRPCAVSPKGAQGLMQLMPDTASDLAVSDPFDPAQNVRGGAKYLRQLLDKYKGDVAQALAAYNAGPNAIEQPPETKQYVDAILQKLGIAH